jgi:hypothetical protein
MLGAFPTPGTLRLLPFLFILYITNYLDRTSFAERLDLEEGAGQKTTRRPLRVPPGLVSRRVWGAMRAMRIERNLAGSRIRHNTVKILETG